MLPLLLDSVQFRPRRLPRLPRRCRWPEILVSGAAVIALCGQIGRAENPKAADRPNIVVILADDLGYGDLSCYGAKDLRSPHIDRLASAGMRMDEFYANCPVCSPTRAALLTGRYQELVGVPGVIRTHARNNWGDLADDAVLLPELLRKAGYRTAIVGKWHLGLESPDRPNDRGFEFFHGFLGDMMDDYYHHRRHEINYMRRNREEIDPPGHATDLFTQWAVQYIREHADSGRESPFFLYLPYNAPHTPIQPPQDWLERIRAREPQASPTRAKLIALIEHMDHGVGEVLKALKETRLDRETLVVFTSDNGGQLSAGANNGGLRDGKQSMYEGGLKAPFCAVWPGRIQAGSRSTATGITMDLFPTICAIAGVEISHTIDGQSLADILTGKKDALPPRDLFFHRREGGDRYGGLTINAMRRGPWKLLQNSPFAPLELYKLDEDPAESKDLRQSQRGKFRELSAALRVQIQRGGAVPWQRVEQKDP